MTADALKILVHDYCGHAFTAQLARQLAWMGHETVYASFADFATPKGRTAQVAGDPAGFKAVEVHLNAPFDKENLLRRALQQRDYARRVSALVRAERPDVVISASAPLEVNKAMADAVRSIGGRFVFWMQDIHSDAIALILKRKNVLLGKLAGAYYRRFEMARLRRADGVVVIAEAFRDTLASWGYDTSEVEVIENWAAIDDLPRRARDNAWARANIPGERLRIVYSGTLARKHNPDMLLELGRRIDADVYLFSEGRSADYVRSSAAAEGLSNVFVRPWVPVDDLPDMLGAADILCVVIEKDAATFSVPSKVLSYLCAGRPILGAISAENLSGQNIVRAGAGLISPPDDVDAIVANARRLLADPTLRACMGDAGRTYAERQFDIDAIARRFLRIMANAAGGRIGSGRHRPRKGGRTAPLDFGAEQ